MSTRKASNAAQDHWIISSGTMKSSSHERPLLLLIVPTLIIGSMLHQRLELYGVHR